MKTKDDSAAYKAARSGCRVRIKNIVLTRKSGQELYLSAILNLHSSYLVSYTISECSVLRMITVMLDKAFETISNGTGLIFHSDQGW